MLPPAPPSPRPAPVPVEQVFDSLAALRPARAGRPVVAVIGINDATETTDYLMPTSILRRADVADVWTLATAEGAVRLYPALQVLPDATLAAFDARHPEGADYVIVPAMSDDSDPKALAWIRAQAAKGAVIIGVCAGARVVANTGLLDGRNATTHWFFLRGLLKKHPEVRYVKDRRFVTDGRVVTTTGISASIPMSLTLIEAIAGPEKARQVAVGLGVDHWDARHDSDAFRFNRSFALQVILNRMQFWRSETLSITLKADQDLVSLALAADAWSRTYRSAVETVATTDEPVLIGGVRVVPDRVGAARGVELAPPAGPVIVSLDRTLADIGRRYGDGTRRVVATQLEYPAPIL